MENPFVSTGPLSKVDPTAQDNAKGWHFYYESVNWSFETDGGRHGSPVRVTPKGLTIIFVFG
jgi:hypothetical protein